MPPIYHRPLTTTRTLAIVQINGLPIDEKTTTTGRIVDEMGESTCISMAWFVCGCDREFSIDRSADRFPYGFSVWPNDSETRAIGKRGQSPFGAFRNDSIKSTSICTSFSFNSINEKWLWNVHGLDGVSMAIARWSRPHVIYNMFNCIAVTISIKINAAWWISNDGTLPRKTIDEDESIRTVVDYAPIATTVSAAVPSVPPKNRTINAIYKRETSFLE